MCPAGVGCGWGWMVLWPLNDAFHHHHQTTDQAQGKTCLVCRLPWESGGTVDLSKDTYVIYHTIENNVIDYLHSFCNITYVTHSCSWSITWR